jgi:hypothetical protein
MSWNGSGTYQRTNGSFNGADVWEQDALASYDIVGTRHDTHDQDIAEGINACLTKDGQNGPTANLPMLGYKHTGAANASSRDQYLTLGQAQDSSATWAGTSGGTANAQTLTVSPSLPAYAAGQRFSFTVGAGLTNTGAATLNINGLGAKNIFSRHTASALVANALIAGLTYEVLYDGTQFLLRDPYSTWISFTPTVTQSATVTTDLVNSNYMIVNSNLVVWECFLRCTSAGTGANVITLSMPVNNAGSAVERHFGSGYFYDASTTNFYNLTVARSGAGTVRFYHDTSVGNAFGASPNLAIANLDLISLTISYRI